jgi:hypothetical protein
MGRSKGQWWLALEPTDDEDTLPPLRYAEVACAEQIARDGVAQSIKVREQRPEESCCSDADDPADVFNDHEPRAQLDGHPQNLGGERVTRVVGVAQAGHGVALAWRSRDQRVQSEPAHQVLHQAGIKVDDVAVEHRGVGLVDLVGAAGIPVEFDRQRQAKPGLSEAEAEAAGAGEQVNNTWTGLAQPR